MRNVPDVSQRRASLRADRQTSQLEARRAAFVEKLAQRATEEPIAAPDLQSVTPPIDLRTARRNGGIVGAIEDMTHDTLRRSQL